MTPELAGLLGSIVLGNTVQSYLFAGLTFLAVLAGLYLVREALLGRLRAWARTTETDLDDFLVELLGRIRAPEYHLIALFIATRSLALSAGVDRVLHLAFVVLLSYRAVDLINSAIGFSVERGLARKRADPPAISAVKNITFVIQAVVWASGLIFVLDNLGINISAAVAGLGIGGVAVAMAGQQILGDLFSSFVIYMDKPFEVGDAIHVGEFIGTVEHIGIKTTRVRSLGGEQLVFSNADLTGSRIRNYKRMPERRVLFKVAAAYATPAEKAKAVPAWIREAVAGAPNVRLERSHLLALGPTALEYEVVYHVLSGDYGAYMDAQQQINLALLERFRKEGVEFAYPTQTVYLAGKGA